MANVSKFADICEKFQDLADFVTIYIAEAHPFESGDLSERYEFKYNTHKEMHDRLEAAEGLNRKIDLQYPLLVDFMDDKANKAYGAYPERLYIILDGIIVYAGGKGPHGYKVTEVEQWLQKFNKITS